MSRVTEQREFADRPAGQFLHVHELPDLDLGGVCLFDHGQEGRVKVLEYFQDLVHV